jgi:hypothetical protein
MLARPARWVPVARTAQKPRTPIPTGRAGRGRIRRRGDRAPFNRKERFMTGASKLVAFSAALALALPVAAQTVKDAALAGEVVTITAKVEAVDQAKRTVAFKGPLGRTLVVKVGDQVKNLPQVKVGDELVVKYAEAVSLKLEKSAGGRSETVTTTGAAAPAGAKPGGAMVQQTVIVANVERVDAAKSAVLLEGPNANYVEVKVKDPAIMKDVKVNDKVVATFTEAVVVEIVAPAKK